MKQESLDLSTRNVKKTKTEADVKTDIKTDVKTDVPLSFINRNGDAKIYGVEKRKPYPSDEKKPYLSAKALGGDLTRIAVRIAVKNKSIKGSKDYHKVDRALIHLCKAIKALEG